MRLAETSYSVRCCDRTRTVSATYCFPAPAAPSSRRRPPSVPSLRSKSLAFDTGAPGSLLPGTMVEVLASRPFPLATAESPARASWRRQFPVGGGEPEPLPLSHYLTEGLQPLTPPSVQRCFTYPQTSWDSIQALTFHVGAIGFRTRHGQLRGRLLSHRGLRSRPLIVRTFSPSNESSAGSGPASTLLLPDPPILPSVN